MARTKGAVSDKKWSDAVRLAINRETKDDDGKKVKRLNALADKLCKMALDGDMGAIKEIGDRLDGKPKQAVDVDHDVSDGLTELLTAISGNGSRLGDS